MHIAPRLAFALLITLLAAVTAGAQASRQVKGAAAGAPIARYFSVYSDLMGDLTVEGFIKELRQGSEVIAAEMNICHSVSLTSDRKDRFVIALKREGGEFVGSGVSLEDRVPISVRYTRRQANDVTVLSGVLTRAERETKFSLELSGDQSEQDFLETMVLDELIEQDPRDFTSVVPGTVAVRMKREAFPDVVRRLNALDVKFFAYSLLEGCMDLRTGEHVVEMQVDPARAAAVLAAARKMPGVVRAGWIAGLYSVESAVRIPAKDWLGADGRLDTAKLGEAVARSLARSFAAKHEATTWDKTTGEMILRFRRPAEFIPGLGLSEIIDHRLLVGPEKPGSTDHLVVWSGYTDGRIADENAEPRIRLTELFHEPHGAAYDYVGLVPALARELKGQEWDSERNRWR